MKNTALTSAMTESSMSAPGPGDGLKRQLYQLKQKRKSKKSQRAIGKKMKEIAKGKSGEGKNSKRMDSAMDEPKYSKPIKRAIGKMKDKAKAKAEDMATGYRKFKSKHGKKSSGSDDMDGICGPGGCHMGKSAPGLK